MRGSGGWLVGCLSVAGPPHEHPGAQQRVARRGLVLCARRPAANKAVCGVDGVWAVCGAKLRWDD